MQVQHQFNGSRAAGGVVLITTKRGSTDEKLNIYLKNHPIRHNGLQKTRK